MRHTLKDQLGATLIEVLVAIALTGIVLPVLATALVTAKNGRSTTQQQMQANALLREGQEAVRSIREKGWTNVATAGTYHPVISGSAWALSSGSEAINGFTRQIVISTPQRNAAGAIVASGGTSDPSTRYVVVTVSWNTPYSNSVSTSTYLSHWQTNSLWTQTSQADFNAGTLTNTSTTNTSGGEVQLQDSPPTWQLPSLIGSYNVTGNVAGNDVFQATIGGTPYAFVGYSGGLAIVNVTDPAAPTLTGTYTTTAAVNGVWVDGNYAYLATAITNAQLTVVNVSNPAAPTKADSIQIADLSNVAATSVYVSGGYAYVTKKKATQLLITAYPEFAVINVSNPTNISNSDSLRLGDDVNGVWVNGNYAYLATGVNNQELTVINVTNKTNISAGTTVDLNADATDVTVSGSTLYVTTLNNGSSGELRTFSLANPASPSAQGSYEVGADTGGVTVENGHALLATSGAGKQFIALNVLNPASPSLISTVSLSANSNKIYFDDRYAYIGSADTSKELTIIYTGYRPSGTFESSSFDAGAGKTGGYNRLLYTSSVPSGSTLQLQVASNDNNSTWNYVGPDGTASTYFTANGSIPLQAAGGRYFRYKASFTPTSNGQQTPVLQDVRVNYSP